ncbi:phosphohistidine-like domain-containing protein [Myxococcota bacterium]
MPVSMLEPEKPPMRTESSSPVEVGPTPEAPLPEPDALLEQKGGPEPYHRVYALAGGELLVVAEPQGNQALVHLRTNLRGRWVLHWGLVSRAGAGWQAPEAAMLPSGSVTVDGRAAQTPFTRDGDLLALDLRVPLAVEPRAPRLLCAVLHRPDTGQWLHDGKRDFQLPLSLAALGRSEHGSDLAHELSARIVDQETHAGSWTLMHRFELCSEMLDEVGDDREALAVLTVWLRYSALRQLDWQRHYNTAPRRLASAQDRLTRRIAQLWRDHPLARPWAQLLLGNVGRGGEGQRVRDDILALMHRHHLKEVAGTFVEQWHQKLHNNTTPDDIAICQAYIVFLRSGGNLKRFDATLNAYGVTRERLAGYDRPIVADPGIPHADIGALVADLEGYLGLLRSVHSSTDLASARVALGRHIVGELDGIVGSLLGRQPLDRADASVAQRARDVLEEVARARSLVADRLVSVNDDGPARDLLYLDLALSDTLRATVEQLGGIELEPSGVLPLVGACLRAVTPTLDDPELHACARHWQRVAMLAQSESADVALRARSIVERLSRWLAAHSQALVAILQSPVTELGRAFDVEPWALRTFAEEIVRGGPLFSIGSLLGRADAVFRGLARLGSWQVVSAGFASGRLVHVARLLDIQGCAFVEDSVVLSDDVNGDEEIPPRVTAVVTGRAIDLLSHLAVRAREAGVLLATLWDAEQLAALAEHEGTGLDMASTNRGNVEWNRRDQPDKNRRSSPSARRVPAASLPVAKGSGKVLGRDDFRSDSVGAKSRVLAELRATLPDWIEIPASMAIGFGGFERTLEYQENTEQRQQLATLEGEVDRDWSRTLARMREIILTLRAPAQLVDELGEVARAQALPLVRSFDASWRAIKQVWGSKWNDRAYLARTARGLLHDRVQMAVLIQRVVETDYAFVAHTQNPLAPHRHEMYGELVLGLGETLVGNYPGRALGVVIDTHSGNAQVVSYPSKSTVLRTSGLIFRSDSNAEDLAGFSGAGLHDSVTSSPMRASVADYTDEPLLYDDELRVRTFEQLRQLGMMLERARGAPQDIEGALRAGVITVLQSRPQAGL